MYRVPVGVFLGVAAVWFACGTPLCAAEEPSSENAKPAPAAAKVPGKDYPYGDGVVYRREVYLGSFVQECSQDGPPLEIEGNFASKRLPNGDCYLLHPSARIIRKYDAKRNRVYTLA